MLKPILRSSPHIPSCLLSCRDRPGALHQAVKQLSSSVRQQRARRSGGVHCNAAEETQSAVFAATVKTPPVKAVVTVKETVGGVFAHMDITRGVDEIIDLLGKTILLELVSQELDPKTGLEKETIQAFAHRAGQHGGNVHYEASFTVPMDFGKIGAVLVTNEHHKEMFFEDIVLTTGDATTAKTISCKSWVHSKFDSPIKRIFFTSKCYLPSQTPRGLLNWRQKELENLRGDGTGMRKAFERIYDYDTYNDLGDPDKGLVRPILGGSKVLPYPRRCRTGRPKTKKDPLSEQRAATVYVPRDEAFSEVKQVTFSTKTLRSVVHALIPSIESAIIDANLGFSHFTAIDSLFKEGVTLPIGDGTNVFRSIIPRLVKAIEETEEGILLFEAPAIIDRDKFSWFRDEEFSRQVLAGLNPVCIQLVTEFPLVSKLDPTIYGPPESAITKEMIEEQIKGFSTVDQAVKEKRLFVLDYHDLLLPYVLKVRELEGSTLYGSRTIFFLTPDDTLRPVAIELTRPASPTKPEWKKVFTHTWDATGTWLWRLAKAHVVAHDSGVHQLVSHWLRTHCCTEPYIIAANRQLSAMHPIYRLLHPHFRYTMEINALAREYLVNADGIIEKTFFPGRYSSEISSVAYRDLWRFDTEALPNDLIQRGMAVKDPTAEHGLRLTIKDYPYANDGLLIWSSVKEWVTDYVSHYYPTASDILGDVELQAWWTEVRTKGHADKKDEPWWPQLNTQTDLIEILTTIIWVVSGHHAAVNFGQYHYGGYFPNRPTITRSNMPVEDENSGEYEHFLVKPESALLNCFPSQIQATIVMSVLDILSNHSPDEEYLGKDPEPAWADNPAIAAAFQKFSGRMQEIDGIIDQRNLDPERRNRFGAGIVPYELLKPFSKPGVTGMGVPNSISI